MSTPLISITVTITKTTANLPAANVAFVNTSVVVTDGAGSVQAPVLLNGSEGTPWSFTTSVAPGSGSVTATDLDANGATIGTPVTQAFTEAGSPPATFPQTIAVTVTP
jgi:hypothetical protein